MKTKIEKVKKPHINPRGIREPVKIKVIIEKVEKPHNSRFPYEISIEGNYGTWGGMYIGDRWTPMFHSINKGDDEFTADELIAIGKAMNKLCNSVREEAEKKGLDHRQWIETQWNEGMLDSLVIITV
jgi:hypothetical protein